ncbi:ATP-binding cassette domain-containing protein [Roseibium sp. LAB1]
MRIVLQELSLAEELAVAENIYLGELPRKSFGRVDWQKLHEQTNRIPEMLKVSFDARTRVGDLSIANRQMVEIARVLTAEAKAVIVDEPTRGIDVGSKSGIHNLIRDLASQGYAVIVISSEIPEVLHVSDRIVAMRSGEIIRTFTSEEITEDNLIQAISGIRPDKAA